MESRGTAPGAQLCAVPSPVGMLGLTACYDLRFPELYQTLRFKQGARGECSDINAQCCSDPRAHGPWPLAHCSWPMAHCPTVGLR